MFYYRTASAVQNLPESRTFNPPPERTLAPASAIPPEPDSLDGEALKQEIRRTVSAQLDEISRRLAMPAGGEK